MRRGSVHTRDVLYWLYKRTNYPQLGLISLVPSLDRYKNIWLHAYIQVLGIHVYLMYAWICMLPKFCLHDTSKYLAISLEHIPITSEPQIENSAEEVLECVNVASKCEPSAVQVHS